MKLRAILRYLRSLPGQLEAMQEALARIESRQLLQSNPTAPRDHEFRAFSQFGEDGILQYLIHNIAIANRVFVEFGASDYVESNTRFLLQNDNWSGLVIDGSPDNIEFIRNQPNYWRHNLQAACAFVDRDNINSILRDYRLTGEIGVLSIDIDGNDYWVWQAIDCINPAIVVCEYNSLLGEKRQLTVPYESGFSRSRAHYSCLYFGASLAALASLGQSKGYALVGSNGAGNNAFFIRRELLGRIPELSAAQAYVRAQFRESRDSAGRLSFLDFDAGIRLISDLPLYDCESRQTVSLKDVRAPG